MYYLVDDKHVGETRWTKEVDWDIDEIRTMFLAITPGAKILASGEPEQEFTDGI